MKRTLITLRMWLIHKLAGDMTIVIGLSVHNGDVFWREAPTLLVRGTFLNNRFHCETPAVEAALRKFMKKVPS